MTLTRFPPLALDKIGREWSFFDISDGEPHRVGQVYKTKFEAMVDLPRYAADSWGYEA